MLNITNNTVKDRVEMKDFHSPTLITATRRRIQLARLILVALVVGIIIMVLPWTQTVSGEGKVTSLRPEQRPQSVQSVISGRIEEWYVQEGQRVDKGDTILFISETKDKFFDPELLSRTTEQIEAKEMSATAYSDKIEAYERQIVNLSQGRDIKLNMVENKILQARLKVTSDSTSWEASRTQYEIGLKQYERAEISFEQDLISRTELELKSLKLREAEAKEFSANNKMLESRNKYLNAIMELNETRNKYDQELAKAQADKFTTVSLLRDAEISVSKLKNQLANYSIRRGLYYVTAPQDGYITQAAKNGIGETVKEGQNIVTIMPEEYDLAVELYIRAQDLPLIEINSQVRLIFDGWPALVFSGWPGVSSGTFGGRVVAIDRFTSGSGDYRLLVSPDSETEAWPEALRPGSGVKGMALLGDVTIGYELWRKLNGFPPSFYESVGESAEGSKPKTKNKGGGK